MLRNFCYNDTIRIKFNNPYASALYWVNLHATHALERWKS